MPMRHLINEGRAPFDDRELEDLVKQLDALNGQKRREIRDTNAEAIASHRAAHILIVAGPGTGKSTLFKQRILYWLNQNPIAKILALSFVRKLVADLNADIENDERLTKDQKKQVDVFTLHKFARSVVEQNHGSGERKFKSHLQIIGEPWKVVVWRDVLLMSGQNNHERFSWKAFETQLHNNDFDGSKEWEALRKLFWIVCEFYNASGFADLILIAKDALAENPKLNQHSFFIIDEYQDFNAAEENFLEQITLGTKGKLIVGDDDQVLYETLKSGKAALIRAIYRNTQVANAMLPFCGRCNFHIVRAADHFIKQAPDRERIKKIYLPLTDATGSAKVQAVACAAAATAVDYIRKFLEDHCNEIEQRKKDLIEGKSKDAYLLILSPSQAMNFYKSGDANQRLLDLIRPYSQEQRGYSDDYYKVLTYYSAANYPANNFTVRKVLHYEQVGEKELISIFETCIGKDAPFCAQSSPIIKQSLAKADAVREIINSEGLLQKK
jgi:hypothetical protein